MRSILSVAAVERQSCRRRVAKPEFESLRGFLLAA